MSSRVRAMMGGRRKRRQAGLDHENDRGQIERLTFFSDAVFAIAMTLLVIEVRVPHIARLDDMVLAQALVDLLPNYIGFVVSFLVIGRFWVSHHRVFGLLKASSQRLVWTNLLFLLVVAFMPFPTAVMSDYVQLHVGVGFYAGWLVLIGAMNRLVIVTALGDPAIRRDDIDTATIARHRRDSWIPVIIGVAAFFVAMISPVWGILALMIGSPTVGWAIRSRPVRG